MAGATRNAQRYEASPNRRDSLVSATVARLEQAKQDCSTLTAGGGATGLCPLQDAAVRRQRHRFRGKAVAL